MPFDMTGWIKDLISSSQTNISSIINKIQHLKNEREIGHIKGHELIENKLISIQEKYQNLIDYLEEFLKK